MNSKTREIIRGMLASEIRYLLNKAGDPTTPPQESAHMIARLEECSAAMVDFLRAGEVVANAPTPQQVAASFALETVQRGAMVLDEIDAVYENGPGKNSHAHRFVKALRNIARQDPNAVETLNEAA